MAILYVTESQAKISLKNKVIVVEYPDAVHEFPSLRVEKMVIFGNAHIDTNVITHCLKENIDVVFLGNKGQYFGRLQGPDTKSPEVRIAQYKVSSDSKKCLPLAKRFISGKLKNMRVVLQRNSDGSTPFVMAINRLAELQSSLEQAASLETIRGLEGTASRIYFSVFGKMVAPRFTFEKRVRRPPTDPINSLLSFGYTLLLYDMFAAVAQVGLDPYLGILHEDKYGRPSIALDLIEEYRPTIVDLTVLLLVHKRMINPDDFYVTDEGAVLITNPARRKFIEQYEKRMNTKVQYIQGERREQLTYRRTMIKQAYKLARTLKGEDVYTCIEIK